MNDNNPEDKIERHTQFLEQDSENTQLMMDLSVMLIQAGQLSEAKTLLLRLIEIEENEFALVLIARILHQEGELEDALDYIPDPTSIDDLELKVEIYALLAQLYLDLGEEEQANIFVREALKLDEHDYDAQVVNVMLRLNEMTVQTQEIEKLLEINPEDSRLWFALGSVQMSEGEFKGAQKALKQAVKLSPEFYDCWIALGWVQLLSNRVSDGMKAYEQAAALTDEFSDAFGGMAIVHALREEFTKAKELIIKANQLNQDCFLSEVAKSICANHVNPDKAKAHLVKALKSSKVTLGEKLALVLEEMDEQGTLN